MGFKPINIKIYCIPQSHINSSLDIFTDHFLIFVPLIGKLRRMRAEIITIGDEILIGQITDTNSQWIAQRLNEIGISVYQITSVQDDREHILKALAEAEENAELILLTGGLGPTKDDITKRTLVEYFEDELVFHPEIEAHIKELFARIKYRFTKMDIQQAMLPSKAKVLKNFQGTASGMWFEKGRNIFVSMPGVPNEMKGLMENSVLPTLRDSYHLPYILHRTLHTYGLGESRVAERLEDWESALPTCIKLAYLPSYGKVRLRLTARGDDREALEAALLQETQRLENLVGDILVGMGEEEGLELSLQKLFRAHGKTLSLAESCTGGTIASRITAVPGASTFLKGALVAYSREIKEQILGVPGTTIEEHTVVSEEVAGAMATRCRELFRTDYAVSTTGNAGPTTDETDKSLGVVCIAVASPNGVSTGEFFLGQPRNKVIEKASVKALEMLRKEFLKNS